MAGVLADVGGLAPRLRDAADRAWAALGAPGAQWTARERLAIAGVARAARPRPVGTPLPVFGELSTVVGGDDPLSPLTAAVADQVAVAPSMLTRDVVADLVDRLGDAHYAELCSVVCQVVAVDHLRGALGCGSAPFPAPTPGEPSRVRPDDLVDIGGHIVMSPGVSGHNISRSLTLAGADHMRWMMLVFTMYAGEGFDELVWDDHALSRPQVEFLAARTSALNECFY